METNELREQLMQHYAIQIAYIKKHRIKQDALNSYAYDKRKEYTEDNYNGTTTTEPH